MKVIGKNECLTIAFDSKKFNQEELWVLEWQLNLMDKNCFRWSLINTIFLASNNNRKLFAKGFELQVRAVSDWNYGDLCTRFQELGINC